MARLSTNYDRIITSAPLDRQAAVVGAADGDGADFTPERMVGDTQQWLTPPACRPVPAGVESIIGRVVGRLTVVGYYGTKPKTGSRWLVRCSCGVFETRRTKTITEQKSPDEQACAMCQKAQQAARNFKAAVSGRWPDGTKLGDPLGLNTSTGFRRLKDGAA